MCACVAAAGRQQRCCQAETSGALGTAGVFSAAAEQHESIASGGRTRYNVDWLNHVWWIKSTKRVHVFFLLQLTVMYRNLAGSGQSAEEPRKPVCGCLPGGAELKLRNPPNVLLNSPAHWRHSCSLSFLAALSSELVAHLLVRDQLRTKQDAMLLDVQDLT